jgi:uncharacterized protein YndB with AHSA1/START domain
MSELTVKMIRTLPATPEQVFQAWTKPEWLKKWWCTPGYHIERLAMDLRPSGAYRFELVPDEGQDGPICTMEGAFQEVQPGARLVYSWTIRAADFEEAGTTVQVNFDPHEQGTAVTLVHEGFATVEGYQLHELDWSLVLTNLEQALTPQPVNA